MYKLIKDLTNLNRVFCSSDYDKTIKYLKKILKFKIKTFSNKSQINGWVIPPKWDIKEAKIFKQDKLLYDASKNPLSLIALSKEFSGHIDLKTLKKHLHYDYRFKYAIPFHFRQMYKSWNRDWGFCVTKKLYDSLSPGKYNVVIKTQESKGILKVLEYNISGKYPYTFAFVAHLDHPGMSNDNLSGCAVGIELFKYLSKQKLKFSYSLILTQEIIGSEYYLNSINYKNKKNVLEALYLDTLGSKTKLSIQSSINKNTNIEFALEKILKKININYNKASYRSLTRNDESSWTSHKIPMSTLTRFPYPQYHSSKDNISIISKKSLLICSKVLKKTINFIEKTEFIEKKFQGIICLSNPKYNLYIDDGQPAFGKKVSIKSQKIRKIIELIPLLEKPTSIDYISKTIGLNKKTILLYLKKWKEKKLIAIL
tara:strand:- start:130 stop:1407 length:1278 start_codon:yes stop_codon:yes gene_type:complete